MTIDNIDSLKFLFSKKQLFPLFEICASRAQFRFTKVCNASNLLRKCINIQKMVITIHLSFKGKATIFCHTKTCTEMHILTYYLSPEVKA